MRLNGLKHMGLVRVRLSRLHCQYIKQIFNKEFWPGDNCMLISNSPHVRLLKKYIEVGLDWNKLWETDYVRMMEYWNSIGFHNRPAKFIKNKVQRCINVYESIKKRGYDKKDLIQILKTPLSITRYSTLEPWLSGYEIWHGHHRSAACYVLGIKKVNCKLLKDIEPGSKKCDRIDKRLKLVKTLK